MVVPSGPDSKHSPEPFLMWSLKAMDQAPVSTDQRLHVPCTIYTAGISQSDKGIFDSDVTSLF